MRSLLAVALILPLAAALRAQAPEPVLTLDEAIRLALANNRSLKVESYAPGIAHANWLTAAGQFDPSLVFNRSYADARAFDLGSPQLDEIKTDSYSLGLQGQSPWGLTYNIGGTAQNQGDSLGTRFAPAYYTFGGIQITQPLLSGFGFDVNLAGVRIARANRGISEWDYRQTAMDTVTNVVIAYSNLLQAHDGLRIAHKFQDLANSTVDDNQKSYRIGSVSKSDVITAQARAAGQEESVLIADRAVRDAENQLRMLIGQDTFPPDQPLYAIEPVAQADDIAVRLPQDYQTALTLRPDYQAARLGLQINHVTDAAARNGLLPQVDFVGGYGYNGLSASFSAARQMVADQMNPSYSAGVQVTIPLTFAQARGKARAARLQLRQAEESLRLLEANIALSVTTAAGQIETTRKRVAADIGAYNLANQALDNEVKKFHAGTSNILFVLELQGELAQAEINVSNARAAQRQATANYDLQLGSTLLRHNIALAEP